MSSSTPPAKGPAMQGHETSSAARPASTPGEHSVPITPELASLLECPICTKIMLSTIWQCGNGHLMCDTCRWEMRTCHTCRLPLENIRNLGLENLARTLVYPCEFSSYGCTASLSQYNKKEHEKACGYRPLCCPVELRRCMWKGSLSDVMPHIRKAHGSNTTLQGEEFEYVANYARIADEENPLISCFGQHFVLILQNHQYATGLRLTSAVVQVIASEDLKQKFIYKLELCSNKQRLKWEAPVTTIRHIVSPLHDTPFLMIGHGSALKFTEKANLTVKVNISKV